MRFSLLHLLAAVCVITSARPLTAQQITKPGRITRLADPVALDTAGAFNSRATHVGDDMFVSGQPTERALRELRSQGVTVVINLRTPHEMATQVRFNEDSLVTSLGMRYVHLPVRGDSTYPYTPATVTKFAEAIAGANGKVLLHCTIGWRASHLWAAYLISERNVPVEEALANARLINLMDTHRMGTNGRQPIEDFLGRTLPTLGHPPMSK